MGDTTTLVVALALVGGAVYLATREKAAPPPDDEDDGGSFDPCQGLGGAELVACRAIKAGVGKLLEPSECVKRGGAWGYWSERDGFTGLGYAKKPGSGITAGVFTVPKPSASVNSMPFAMQAGLKCVCCTKEGTDPTGRDGTRCADRRSGSWDRLCAKLKGQWSALKSTVRTGPYDHRSQPVTGDICG